MRDDINILISADIQVQSGERTKTTFLKFFQRLTKLQLKMNTEKSVLVLKKTEYTVN